MKKILLSCLVCGLLMSSAQAATVTITNKIPDRYALMVIKDATPGQPLDKPKILELFKTEFEKSGLPQMQFVVYDEGKKAGDGARALGELFADKNKDGNPYIEAPEGKEKLLEKLVGYEIEPKDLWRAYDENEVVADEDFKGKPVLFSVTVPSVSKDAMNKPYIKVPVDKHGLAGLHIYVSMDDPNLRKIKKGSKVVIRGIPQKFFMKDVMLIGEIVMIQDDAPAKGGKKK